MNNSNKQKCKVHKRNGDPCQNFPMQDCAYCYVHSIGYFRGVTWWKNPAVHLTVAVIALLAAAFFGGSRANQKKMLNKQVEIKQSLKVAHAERDEIKEMLRPFTEEAAAQFPNLSEEQALRELASQMQIFNSRLSKTEADIRRNKADGLFGSAFEAEQRKDHALAAPLYIDALLTQLEIPSLQNVQLMARQICINLVSAKRLNQTILPRTQGHLDEAIQALSKHDRFWAIEASVRGLKATRQEVFE